jgi:hypothetical protein
MAPDHQHADRAASGRPCVGPSGFGPARIAATLAQPAGARHAAVGQRPVAVLHRHSLGTRTHRHGLVAGYAAAPQPQRLQPESRARCRRTPPSTWPPPCHPPQPSATRTSALARRVAADLAERGWRLERVMSDSALEFRAPPGPETPPPLPGCSSVKRRIARIVYQHLKQAEETIHHGSCGCCLTEEQPTRPSTARASSTVAGRRYRNAEGSTAHHRPFPASSGGSGRRRTGRNGYLHGNAPSCLRRPVLGGHR